ncbi:MAG: endonuclease MutS2 [Clostridia bacterium]|nr:endonuclease MutS2 [Clostridia bacterium]
MDKKAFVTLEYDKILKKLASYTQNEEVLERIENLSPETELSVCRQSLEETTQAVGLLLRRGNLPGLKITNILPALYKVQKSGRMNCRELLALSNILKVSKKVKRHIEDDKLLPEGRIKELCSILEPLKDVTDRIDEVVLGEEEIADGASTELYSIRRRIKQTEAKIRDTLNSMIASSGLKNALQESIVTMRAGRYVLPVKAEFKGDVKGIVHDSSASGSTVFIEPAQVVSLTNEISELTSREKEEIDRILYELSVFAAEFSREITQNVKTILELDFIFCKAALSISQNATEPILNDDGYIDIKRGRHPLLDKEKVVPIDIYLGKDFDTLVITGPNTGGKTVSLKTLGLFTLMAQSGLHIPAAENSEIGVFENVFADIGDEQSIEQSLSTFSSHIVNLVRIIEQVNHKTLVLTDELGAGTDPTEGAALAISILEYMRARGARIAATTHYSELKMYALSNKGVTNASCEFDVKTLSPTYKLLIGVPGKSNAFAISKRLGINDEIIDHAKGLMEDENVKIEDVLIKLEENRKKAERERMEAQTAARDVKDLKEKMSRESRELDKKRAKLLEDAKMEALRILEDAKDEAASVIKEIRILKSNMAKESLKEAENARNRLSEKGKKLGQGASVARKSSPLKNVKPGDEVYLLNFGQSATVLTAPDSSGNVMVQAGIVKIKANLSDMQAQEKKKENPVKSTAAFKRAQKSSSGGSHLEVDVRGMYLNDAIDKVDKFIDDSVLSGLKTVTIIHGKGTGVLRQGIQDYLRRRRGVSEYRNGNFGEGEMGVTVVTLA